MPALAGEPGRSLCQDVALRLQPPDLLAQPLELAALLRAQRTGLGYRPSLLVRAHHRRTLIGQLRESPARLTHAEIDCSEQPNSLARSAIRRPLAYSSTICCRNAAGYGGLVFPPMSDSFHFPS